MNGIKYLLDTNVIIGMYEQSLTVINLFQHKNIAIKECAYSAVTRMELLGFPKITPYEIDIISDLLEQMHPLPIESIIENRTISLKQTHQIKLPDAIILATSQIHCIELLTLDKKLANKC